MLLQAGFVHIRSKGSHRIYVKVIGALLSPFMPEKPYKNIFVTRHKNNELIRLFLKSAVLTGD